MNLLFLERIDFFPIEIRGTNTEYYMHWILLSEFLGFFEITTNFIKLKNVS
jgi:hypothetical protein